jgi:hypothetical protein
VNGNEIVFGSQFVTNTISFQYDVTASGQSSGDQTLSGDAEYMLAGMANPATVSATPLGLTLSPIYELVVVSTHGGALPATGASYYDNASAISASITNSPLAGSAGTRYVCTGWSGSGSLPATGSATYVPFSLTSDSALTWNWDTQYQLTAAAGTGGQATPTSAWFVAGASDASVLAIADADYSFAGWTGDVPAGKENDNPLVLTMDAPRAVTATFTQDDRTLTVVSAQNGATPAVGTHTYSYGTGISAAVTTSPLAGAAGTRYVCTGWSGSGSVPAIGSATNIQFTLTSDSGLTWNWDTQYQLTATAGTGGQATPPSAWFLAGASDASVLASADADYSFAGWTGDVPVGQENDNPLVLTMDAPRAVTATFTQDDRTLTVASAQNGATPAVGTHTYSYGTDISAAVTTSPLAGAAGTRYVCTGWTGTGSVPAIGSSASVVITLRANSTIDWQWKTQYQISTDAASGGQAVADNDWFDDGTTATATATPISGFTFTGWIGDVPAGQELDNPLTLTMSSPRSVTAQFAVDGNAIHANHATIGTYRAPSTDTVVTATFTYPAGTTIESLVWQPTLPAGWTIASASGSESPDVVGSTLVFTTLPTANPLTFQYSISVPGGDAMTAAVGGNVAFQLQGMGSAVTIPAAPGSLDMVRLHSSDYASQDWKVDGAEVGRVLAYWRAGGYQVNPDGHDGFSQTATPDVGNTNGGLHSADYREPYRVIDGTELSRVLAYWRAGGYQVNPEGADGYTPAAYAPASLQNVDGYFLNSIGGSEPNILQTVPNQYAPGATLAVTNTLTYSDSLLSLFWRPTIPDGWEIISVSGDGTPELVRDEIVWLGAIPPSPIQMVYTLAVPIWAMGEQRIGCAIEYQPASTANPVNGIPAQGLLATLASDSDENGLADGWEAFYAGGSGGLSSDADDDADGMVNLAEFLAGTAPNDAHSVLAMSRLTRDSNDGIAVSWQSAPGRLYKLLKTTSLGEPFQVVQGDIAATPPLNVFNDSDTGTQHCYYRIEVQL